LRAALLDKGLQAAANIGESVDQMKEEQPNNIEFYIALMNVKRITGNPAYDDEINGVLD